MGSPVPALGASSQAPHTHLLSLCSRGPNRSLWGRPSESLTSCRLPPPHPVILGETCKLGGGGVKHHLSRGPHGSRLSFRSNRAGQTWRALWQSSVRNSVPPPTPS